MSSGAKVVSMLLEQPSWPSIVGIVMDVSVKLRGVWYTFTIVNLHLTQFVVEKWNTAKIYDMKSLFQCPFVLDVYFSLFLRNEKQNHTILVWLAIYNFVIKLRSNLRGDQIEGRQMFN